MNSLTYLVIYFAFLSHNYVKTTQIIYTLNTDAGTFDISQYDLTNIDKIKKEKDLKIIIHGWLDCMNTVWSHDLINEYIQTNSYNVIGIDWSFFGRDLLYYRVKNFCPEMGMEIGKFLLALCNATGIEVERVHLIGHSLGSHIAGHVGKYIKKYTAHMIGRITGLDPAGPGFYTDNVSARLSKFDALFVDTILTDAGGFGIKLKLGHANFFPNGGTAMQNGCGFLRVWCSHLRSVEYFAESIRSEHFVASSCTSFTDYQSGLCNKTSRNIMGEHINTNVSGNFYLETNIYSPFAKNGSFTLFIGGFIYDLIQEYGG